MTHSTRLPRNKTDRPARGAPRYQALSGNDVAALSEDDRRRYLLMLDLQDILDAEQPAALDARSVGTPGSYRPKAGGSGGIGVTTMDDGSDEATLNSVEAASQLRTTATDWLAERTEAIAGLIRAARTARRYWPRPLPAGTKMSQDGQQVTVGTLHTEAGRCPWCGHAAIDGRDPDSGRPLLRHVGNIGIHTNPCYWAIAKRAQRAGQTIADHLTAMSTQEGERTAS